MIVSLGIGLSGRSAARLVEVARGRGREKLFESLRMEELPVRIGRSKKLAIRTHVKVILNLIIFKLNYFTTSKREYTIEYGSTVKRNYRSCRLQ